MRETEVGKYYPTEVIVAGAVVYQENIFRLYVAMQDP